MPGRLSALHLQQTCNMLAMPGVPMVDALNRNVAVARELRDLGALFALVFNVIFIYEGKFAENTSVHAFVCEARVLVCEQHKFNRKCVADMGGEGV